MTGPPSEPNSRRSAALEGGPIGGATRVDSKAFRRRVGRSEVLETIAWLTPRDRSICSDVFEHKVLTAGQIARLHFTHPRIANRRLLRLFEHQVLDRFRPHQAVGSAPNHYILGDLGAHVIAGERGIDIKAVRERRRSDVKLAYSPRLRHLVEVNDFFSALSAACRAEGSTRLLRWWSERRCAVACRDVVRPDGLGEVAEGRRSCTFFLELDRGTERGDRLPEKLRSYEWFASLNPDLCETLLFLFPTATREIYARKRLAPIQGLVVATAHRTQFAEDPLARNWLPLEDDVRLGLLELPHPRGDV